MATKKAKQPRLPGQEDAAIAELETAAEEYVSARDERQAMLANEVELKNNLLALMTKHKKEHYEHDGIVVDVVPEGVKLKVKISKPKADEEAA
jgi:hypothetical protein